MQSCIKNKTSVPLTQEQIQYPSFSGGQQIPSSTESLQTKLFSLKKEIANIQFKNALLDKRRGFKHCVAFLLGF